MKQVITTILATDDVHRIEGRPDVVADSEASLGFMGSWYNLDLTSDHYMELSSLVNKWIAAGEPTDEPYNGRKKPGKPLGAKMDNYRRHRAWHFAVFGAEVPRKQDGQGYKYDYSRGGRMERWRAWEAEHGPYTEDKKELARGGAG